MGPNNLSGLPIITLRHVSRNVRGTFCVMSQSQDLQLLQRQKQMWRKFGVICRKVKAPFRNSDFYDTLQTNNQIYLFNN